MILSVGLLTPSGSLTNGFVEFFATGSAQSITTDKIPSIVTRVRVHLIGAGGDMSDYFSARAGINGAASSFSAAGVSVITTGGTGGAYNYNTTASGGSGGSVSAVSGIVGQGTGGAGGNEGNGSTGLQGTQGIDVGVGMGGGGGGSYR
jgi:hypothetical protein